MDSRYKADEKTGRYFSWLLHQ